MLGETTSGMGTRWQRKGKEVTFRSRRAANGSALMMEDGS